MWKCIKYHRGLWIILIIVGIIFGLFRECRGQIIQNYYLDSIVINNPKLMTVMGTCGSPNGSVNEISASPPNYAWLQINGYCNPGSYGKSGTVCWTFINPGSCVSINSGFATLGCAGASFGPFTLYTCAPACVGVGTGLTYCGLTAGACYTWCMTYSGSGPPSCEFTDFCPYFQNTTPLPVELLDFYCIEDSNNNVLFWNTASEINVDKFRIEGSGNMLQWTVIQEVGALGENTTTQYIAVVSKFRYFRLYEVDYSGQITVLKTISCDNNYYLKDEFVEVFSVEMKLVYSGLRGGLKSKILASGLYIEKTSKLTKKIQILYE